MLERFEFDSIKFNLNLMDDYEPGTDFDVEALLNNGI